MRRRADLQRALIAERCIGIAIFQGTVPLNPQSFSWSQEDGPDVTWLPPLRALGILQRDAISYLDTFQAALDALTRPTSEMLMSAKTLDEALSPSDGPFSPVMTRILPIVIQACVKREAYRDVVRTGLAVERYRIVNGDLPPTLKQLVPTYLDSVPVDPYDGKPLRFHRLNPGYVVYSIGINLTDDDGKEPSGQRSGQNDSDITFVVDR